MGQVYFHIGHHKTATTWLQQRYFSAHPQLTLLNDTAAPWRDELLQGVIGASERTFDSDVVQQLLNQRLSEVQDSAAIVSAERLSGHPISGGFDSFMIARRIKKISPNAKILIGVRHQISMVKSIYQQMLKEGYLGSLAQFLSTDSWKKAFFNEEYLHYHYIVEYYQQLFGTENVHVGLFEELNENPELYVERLCDFLNVDFFYDESLLDRVNKTQVDVEALLLRNLSLFSEFNTHPAPDFIPDDMLGSWKDSILDEQPTSLNQLLDLSAIAESNKHLFKLICRDNYYENFDSNMLTM